MARCEICSKRTSFGNKVSHSVRKTRRTWKPNLRRIKAVINGTPKTINICTRCLRLNKVTRAI
jgi:large subunit ribosomal protein L28